MSCSDGRYKFVDGGGTWPRTAHLAAEARGVAIGTVISLLDEIWHSLVDRHCRPGPLAARDVPVGK